MSNFLKAKIEILKKKNFFYPELELRILLNKFSVSTEEIILSNFKENQIDVNQFEKAFERRSNFEPISKIFNEKYFGNINSLSIRMFLIPDQNLN